MEDHNPWDIRKHYEINLINDPGMEKLLDLLVDSEQFGIYDHGIVLEQLNKLPENQRKVLIENYHSISVQIYEIFSNFTEIFA